MSAVNILDYGAVENELCTEQIQAAFNAAAETGGTVLIPAGTFVTGTINMKNASMCLEKNAVLEASGNMEDYRFIGYSHNEMGDICSLLYSMETDGVSIWGEGMIDLNGKAFYNFDKRSVPESKIALTKAQIEECTAEYIMRPKQPIFFYQCSHISVRGIRIVNAPSWTMAFLECSDVRVTDLTIDNDLRIPNCDGMHFSSCDGVIVRGCNISSADDCIAFTAITNWERPCQKIAVSDCILRSCSKTISVGYMHSVVRDVAISNCVIYGSNRAIAIMSSAGTGLVENVLCSNLRLDTRIRAGNWWGNGEPVCVMGTYHNIKEYRDAIPARDNRVCVRNVYFNNIVCTAENVIAVIGENGSVENVNFDNVSFELKESDNLAIKGRIVDLAPGAQTAVLPENNIPYWLFVKQSRGVRVSNARVAPFHGKVPEIRIEDCDDVTA
jgi:hypothetical protein